MKNTRKDAIEAWNTLTRIGEERKRCAKEIADLFRDAHVSEDHLFAYLNASSAGEKRDARLSLLAIQAKEITKNRRQKMDQTKTLCPFCASDELSAINRVTDGGWAIKCFSCYCFGPAALTAEGAWIAWARKKERDGETS